MSKKMPIDIGELVQTVANVGQERDLPVYVDLVFDPTANDELIDAILDAFPEDAEGVFIEHEVIGTKVPDLSVPCDLCVIVGGDSLLLGDTASAARAKGIPAVVAIARGKTYFSDDPASAQAYVDATIEANREGQTTNAAGTASVAAPAVGKGVPVDDIIDIDLDGSNPRPLEELGAWIVANAPAKRISMAADFPFLRHPLAVDIMRQNAIQNGAVGLVFFLPGADMPVITLNQAIMAIQIAAIYGEPLTMDRAKEIAVVVAGGFGFRTLSRSLVSVVPVLGWAIKPTVAASGTVAMGYALIDYFEGGIKPGSIPASAESTFVALGKLVDKGADKIEKAMDGYLAHRSWKRPRA